VTEARILFPPPQTSNYEKDERKRVDRNIHPSSPRNDIEPLQKVMRAGAHHRHSDPHQKAHDGVVPRFEHKLFDVIVEVVPHPPIRTATASVFNQR